VAEQTGTPGRTRTTLALFIDDFLDRKSQNLIDGASDFTRESGINLIVSAAPVVHDVCPLRDLIGPQNVDGVLVHSGILTNYEKDATRIARFFERYRPLPAVCIGDQIENVHSMTIDNKAGMSELVNHVIKVHGYKKIAFIRGPETNREAEQRYAVYREVLEQNGIPFNSDLVADGNWSHASGSEAIHTLRDQRGTDFRAVIAANDAMAAGAFEALHARALRVPDDVAVVGFDNFGATGFGLTTVHQPVYELARKAGSVLLELVRGVDVPLQTKLPTRLIVRRSCGCFGTDVVGSVAQPAVGNPRSLPAFFIERRSPILLNMTRAAGGKTASVTPEWLENLFNTFEREMTGGPQGEFITALDSLLMQKWMERQGLGAWQNIISVLRRDVLTGLIEPADIARAENIWHQARVLIAEAGQRVRAHNRREQVALTLKLMDINEAFYAADLHSLTDTFAHKLPGLGIDRCYVTVFEGNNPVPETARLVLAFDEEERVPLDGGGQRFPAAQLLPEEVLPDVRPVTLLAAPLVKDGKHMGLIFFERGPAGGYLYETLRRQFTEPLSRILSEMRTT
jgi:DNA-binding LacI/PurR family transcriptional regulator